jgi:DNA-binding Xre family transcriptional regulator
MTTTINYTEAAVMLGVHRESIANYVRRGLLTTSSTNSKAVTLQSVQNLINKHHEVLDITKEVEQMKENLQKEKDHLSVLRQEVKDKIEYNKVKGITFQNIGYICDALLVYLDSF